MFLDSKVGNLTEPLTGRKWDPPLIMRQVHQRIAYYQSYGMSCADRVFVHYGNTLEFFADLMAIWSLGGCVIPIDSRLTKFEVETLARTVTPRFSLWHHDHDESITACLSALDVKTLTSPDFPTDGIVTPTSSVARSQLSLDQDALILFTSGTTGQPKGVVHTHRSLRARWMTLQQCLGLEAYRRTLCLLPTHFGHGLICNCLFPWFSGQDLFIVPPFKPDLIVQLGALLDTHKITFLSSVPSVWRLVLKMAKPPQSRNLKRVFCGSAPLSAFLWKDIQEWTGTENVLNAYGITETGSWVAGTTVPQFTPEDGLIGTPWGAVVKILQSANTEQSLGLGQECAPGESGYVWLNTPALMKGYFGRDDLTQQVTCQGWFMTGDIGCLDDRGLLYLKGREREEINKGGMKVYPSDLDTVIERFAGVNDVCTFSYNGDPLYGQNIGVAVVLQEASAEIIRHLYAWVTQHVAKHQVPVRWYIVEHIPRTSRGKLNRAKVAEACAQRTPVDIRRVLKGARE